jgi:hypothetical protein
VHCKNLYLNFEPPVKCFATSSFALNFEVFLQTHVYTGNVLRGVEEVEEEEGAIGSLGSHAYIYRIA